MTSTPGAILKGTKNTYILGAHLATGGEGTVYRAGPGRVIKIYHQAPSREQQSKLAAMIQTNRPVVEAVSAWPIDVVFGANNAVIGFVMPEITNAYPLVFWVSPDDRKRIVPNATYGTLVTIATNLCRALIALHLAEVVVGDINTQNILATVHGNVYFIDSDSFQLRNYRCLVGVEDFTAPELQGVVDLGAVPRSVSHDAFALAVLIFHLLAIGRHPFVGGASTTLSDAIKQRDYMLARRGTDPLTALGLPPSRLFTPPVAKLFERAFVPGRLQSRPTPFEWMHALDDLLVTLRDCPTNHSHRYAATADCCPWCGLERSGRPFVFSPPDPGRTFVQPPPPRFWWKPWTWW